MAHDEIFMNLQTATKVPDFILEQFAERFE